jgi:hypothetical protein
MASKLPIGKGKYANTDGRAALIRFVIASNVLYPLALPLPKGILTAISKLERAFLWAASDKVSGGKCKVKNGGGLLVQKHGRSWYFGH